MLENIKLTVAITSFLIGFVFGATSVLLFDRKNLSVEKIISIILFAIWISIHIYGFFFEKEITYLFDLIGFGATGGLIGLSWGDIIDRLVIKKN